MIEEVINGILFLVFGLMAIVSFHMAVKIWICPSWKYNEARKKKFSGLAINTERNQWIGNKVASEVKVKEILQ